MRGPRKASLRARVPYGNSQVDMCVLCKSTCNRLFQIQGEFMDMPDDIALVQVCVDCVELHGLDNTDCYTITFPNVSSPFMPDNLYDADD